LIRNIVRKLIPAEWRPIRHLESLTWKQTGSRVRSGPFEGMAYIFGSVGSAFIPKLLGIYERELNPAIVRAVASRFDRIVDVGAGEGYYAVGMALGCPKSAVVAYEMDPKGQANIRQLADRNHVGSRVEIRGQCIPADLAVDLDGRPALLICDCEGFEKELLDPTLVPGLASTTILVEVHEFIIPGIADELSARFAATHLIERIWQTDRSVADFPFSDWYTRLLPRSYINWAVDEWRPERMSWLWMVPKAIAP